MSTNVKQVPSSFKQFAYEIIRDRVISGHYGPGTRISDALLAKELQISRSPIREAVSQLESDGLIQQVPHYGVFVREIDQQTLAELYELRELLETFAAGQAAQRATLVQIEQIGAFCGELRRLAESLRKEPPGDLSEAAALKMVQADLGFHALVMQAAGNSQLQKTMRDTGLLTRLHQRRGTRPPQGWYAEMVRLYRVHSRIYRAIRRRRAQRASELMREHLQYARDKALRRMAAERTEHSQVAAKQRWPSSVSRLIFQIEGRT